MSTRKKQKKPPAGYKTCGRLILKNPKGNGVPMTDKKFLNFFLFYSPPNREICEHLIHKAHDHGLRISHIVEVSVMRDEESVNTLKQYRDEYNDEIVPWMSPDTEMLKELDICEPSSFFCYFSHVER